MHGRVIADDLADAVSTSHLQGAEFKGMFVVAPDVGIPQQGALAETVSAPSVRPATETMIVGTSSERREHWLVAFCLAPSQKGAFLRHPPQGLCGPAT